MITGHTARFLRAYGLALLLALLLAAPSLCAQQTRLRVGSKAFTEGIILGEIVAGAAAGPGVTVEHRRSLGGTQILWKALVAGEIDAYVEYTGTIGEEILGGRVGDTASVRRELERAGIRMLAPLGFNNTYALGMRDERARSLGIASITDLESHPGLRLGFSNEFLDREDGWPGLRNAYGLAKDQPRGLDHDIAYRALVDGEIDVVDLYSTDAEIEYYRLRVLDDDRHYFPAYDAVILYRARLDSSAPLVMARLRALSGTIDEERMVGMNAAVKLRKHSESRVAREFLAERDSTISYAEGEEAGVVATILDRTIEHVALVGISLVAAILAGVPLGIVASRIRWLGQALFAMTSIVYTIPSLALLVVMIPLLGIGTLPVMVALFLYSLLPIVRNTFTGIAGIAPPLVESAIALGLSRRSRLRHIELPLALPTILAGVKTAAVMNVATATIGALIGAGGYGQPILTGIRLDDTGLILQGAVPAALLALIVQGLFEILEKRISREGSTTTNVERRTSKRSVN